MADQQNDPGNKSKQTPDSDADLQNELSREAAEGGDAIGDVASNRTLTGSSSWETLPDDTAAERTQKSSRESTGPSSQNPEEESRS